MFLSYYGLREQPFGVTPDPRYLYQSAVHREALASLVYGIEAELGFTSLIAEPGMGKTTLLYYLLARYRINARTAFIFETQCDSRELLQHVCAEFEISERTKDVLVLRDRFKEFLIAQARARRRVLIIIDEAQNLSHQVMETVRLLSNFETSEAKLLHILLAGQPQLADKLARPDLKQLRQRIAMFTRLAPFTAEDTKAYIEHRLAVAGYKGGPLFTPGAYQLIAAETLGIPREINRMCFNALSLGYALQKKTLDAQELREVSLDLQIRPDPRRFAADSEEGAPKTDTAPLERLSPAPLDAPRTNEPGEQDGRGGHVMRARNSLSPEFDSTPFKPAAAPSSDEAPRHPSARSNLVPSSSSVRRVGITPLGADRPLVVPVEQAAAAVVATCDLADPEVPAGVAPLHQQRSSPAAGEQAEPFAGPSDEKILSGFTAGDAAPPRLPADSSCKSQALTSPSARQRCVTQEPAESGSRVNRNPAMIKTSQMETPVQLRNRGGTKPQVYTVSTRGGAGASLATAGHPYRITAAQNPKPPVRAPKPGRPMNVAQLAAFVLLCPSLLCLLLYLIAHYGWFAKALFFDR